MIRPLNKLRLKIWCSDQGHLLANCRTEKEKFYPGPGLELEPLAFRANALPLSYPGQVRVHDRINLLELSFLTPGLINGVVIMSHEGKHFFFFNLTSSQQTALIWKPNFQYYFVKWSYH